MQGFPASIQRFFFSSSFFPPFFPHLLLGKKNYDAKHKQLKKQQQHFVYRNFFNLIRWQMFDIDGATHTLDWIKFPLPLSALPASI